MEQVNLEQINGNIILLMKEIRAIKELMEEPYLEVSDEVIEEVEYSRNEPRHKLISHEDMKKEFG